MITLEDILDNPEIIKTISDAELHKLLTPYYPAVRQSVLPQEKVKRRSNAELMMLDVLRENKDLIDKMRKERTK